MSSPATSTAVESPVLVDEPAAGVRRVRLHRPDRRNAVDRALLDGVRGALEDPPRALVLASTSEAAFCAGIDLDIPDDERADVSDGLYALYEEMVRAPTIILAAVRGPAVGAGAQLAVAADQRVAHPDAWLRFPGVGHGLAVGAWGLVSLIGRGRALRVCTTMERIPAGVAATWGLVDAVEEDPATVACDLAAELATRDHAALARLKRVAATAAGLLEALRQERRDNRAAWSGSTAGLDRPRVSRAGGPS